jgi:hypothetical protein
METLQRTANRGSVSTGYDIDNSCKFEADNSEYLSRTPSSAGNRRTWTFSGWVKRTEIGSGGNTILSAGDTYIQFDGNALQINFRAASENFFIITNRLFRDTSAWYHIVVQCDTTQGTASNRAKVWVNGVQETSFSTSTYDNMSQNYDTLMNSTNEHEVGKYSNEETTYANFFNGYITELHLVDGTALTPTSFGEFDDDSGIWIPKAYTGSHGTNGFYLDFEDASNMGNDASGGTDFTETNITAADQATDTPTNNFATGNPLGPFRVGAWNITEGATYAQYAGGNDWGSFTSTIAVGSGKWYVEIQAGGSDLFIGAGSEDYNFVGAGNGTGFPEIYYGYTSTNSVGYHANNGDVYNNGTQVVIGTTYTTNDIISVALDMDNGKIYFAKNGTYINSQNPATGANSIALPDTSARYFIGGSSYGTGKNHRCNYGGYTSFTISSGNADANGYGNFEYAVPSGFYSLNTKNLAEFG